MGYGENLKQAARDHGISIRKLGLLTKVSPDTLYSAIRRDTGLRFDQALRVAEYLGIRPDRVCGQCYFGDEQEGLTGTDSFLADIREGRKKALIQKSVEILKGFDEDQLDIAEIILEILENKRLEELIWLMDLVRTALHYPVTLLKEWLGETDNPEMITTMRSGIASYAGSLGGENIEGRKQTGKEHPVHHQ